MVSFKNCFLFLFCVAASGKLADAAPDSVVDQRVVGGTDALEGEYPYTVELIFNYDPDTLYDYCTGTLIAPDVVLTAASCLFTYPEDANITAVVGHTIYYSEFIDYPYTVRQCEETVLHPDFDLTFQYRNNDVALCKLDAPIAINETSTYLELNTDYEPEHEEPLSLVGWGLFGQTPTQIGWDLITISEIGFFPPYLNQFEPVFLQKSDQPFLGMERCQTAEDMGSLIIGFSSEPDVDAVLNVSEGMLCTWDKKGQTSRGANSIFGDTGSPLVKITEDADGRIKHTQVGITTAAVLPGITPTVYMDVAYFYDWITSTACNDLGSAADFCEVECKSGKSDKSDKKCKSTKSGKSSKKSSKKVKSKRKNSKASA